MKVYQCKNNCHVNNSGGRCPRCGETMLLTSMQSHQEVVEATASRQRANWKELRGRDFDRIRTSEMQRHKNRLDLEEINYHKQHD